MQVKVLRITATATTLQNVVVCQDT